ncbi:hypothetical protein ACTJJ4_04320 [Microbacterium sp. 22195]|uniref:hypothetical protein n=1 Tax=Microbacterium sp. 22195 TaxID=3453891 RepID=UPI003F876FE9
MQPHPHALRYRTSGLRRATWRIWPWLNWLLPTGFVLFCLWCATITRGESAFLIVVASPLLIPAAGLLGALPRFVLRRQGAQATPLPQVTLLAVLWWSWAALAAAMPDRTIELDPSESVPVPSLLHRLVGDPAGGVLSTWVFSAAIVCGVAAWILLLVRGLGALAIRHPRRWERAGCAAFALAPLLLAGVGGLGVALGQVQTDAAGEPRAQATARNADEQIALAEQRYDAVQQVVADLRAAAAPGGWDSQQACAESLDDDGRGWDAYRLRIGFRHAASFDLDHAALAKAITDAGWSITRDQEGSLLIEATGPQGAHLRFAADGDAPLSITATAGSFWQSADRPVSSSWCSAHGGYSSSPGVRGDGADAAWWPPLH